MTRAEARKRVRFIAAALLDRGPVPDRLYLKDEVDFLRGVLPGDHKAEVSERDMKLLDEQWRWLVDMVAGK